MTAPRAPRRLARCLLLLLVAGLAFAAAGPIMQMDVCGVHSQADSSDNPAMVMAFDQARGLCTISGRSMASSCSASAGDGGLTIQFACTQYTNSTAVQGPAMNLWASYDTPTDLMPASDDLEAPGSSGNLATPSRCNITVMAPALFYHMRADPIFTYGYEVGQLPCGVLPTAAAATSALSLLSTGEEPGSPLRTGERLAMTYGMWVEPSLPGAGNFATEAQTCHVVVTAVSQTYRSTDSFPCSLTTSTHDTLGGGCCYDPSGMRHRKLLMTPELLNAYTQNALRRMM